MITTLSKYPYLETTDIQEFLSGKRNREWFSTKCTDKERNKKTPS